MQRSQLTKLANEFDPDVNLGIIEKRKLEIKVVLESSSVAN